MNQGPSFALIAAALFGISPVLAKLWTPDLNPPLLAGLLYLGSGCGLLLLIALQMIGARSNPFVELSKLSPISRIKLAGAILCGGILAPLSFVASFKLASAFEISLLLNLETVLTVTIAAWVFGEHVGRRVLLSMGLLILAAAISTLPIEGEIPALQLKGSALVVLATFFWAMDNNLTREVEDVPATILTALRGVIAGTFNLLLSFVVFGNPKAGFAEIGSAVGIGVLCYGISLVLFVEALRRIGASRTSAYFSFGPFCGMIFALLFLSEKTAPHQWGAALLGAIAVWLLHRERHDHLHTHESLQHSHSHTHAADKPDDRDADEHHKHSHEGLAPGVAQARTHTHFHAHSPMTHSHRHSPDIHHRHAHEPAAELMLKPFDPEAPFKIAAHLTREAGALKISYQITGPIDQLVLPQTTKQTGSRRDQLWQHTCLELFLGTPDAQTYLEFNFSPSGDWAAYRFTGYRAGMENAEISAPPGIRCERSASQLTVAIEIDGLEPKLDAGLTAVVELKSGQKHYYALKHPGSQPDFHHRDAFIVRI